MIFKFTDMASLGQAIAGIFTSNGKGLSDAQTASDFKNNVFFLIVSTLACTPVIPALSALAKKNGTAEKVWRAVGAVIPAVLIVLSSLALAGDSYNPFMYFRF